MWDRKAFQERVYEDLEEELGRVPTEVEYEQRLVIIYENAPDIKDYERASNE